MEVLWVVLVLGVVGAVLWFTWQARKKRRLAFAAFAKSRGMQYDQGDPLNSLQLPFKLLNQGDGRGVENTCWGAHNDRPIRVFDYWYYTESTDSKGQRSRSYRRFNCALIEVQAAFSALEVKPEGFFTKMADAIGLQDIDLESADFNRTYNVKSKDRQFAYAFLDARLMQWLLWLNGQEPGFSFEVAAGYLMGYRKKMKPEGLGQLIDTVDQLRERVPRAALSMYGGEAEIAAPVADKTPQNGGNDPAVG